MASLVYTSVEDFTTWVSENFAGIISNDNVNTFTVDSDQEAIIETALRYAEGRVDGALSKRGYQTPVPSHYERTIDVLTMYINNLAVYELYGRRGITKEQFYKYKRTSRELRMISTGGIALPNNLPKEKDSGVSSGSSLTSVFAETNFKDKGSI